MKVSIESRNIPLNYTNETGYSWYGSATQHAWRYMEHIRETAVTLEYNDGTILNTTFSWIMNYGWAPGHTSFMDDCSIVIANLGLHYNRRTGALANAPPSRKGALLANDFRAAITYLTDFTSSGDNRIAIWRSALPQHFDNDDGHFGKAGDQCSLLPRKPSGSDAVIQEYNKLYNNEFAKFCNVQQNQSTSDCGEYEHTCTVDRTSMDYPTPYKYFIDSKCCEKRLNRLRKGNTSVTGTILRWNIADLFDVPLWHASKGDCSHFCYVPQLYEAAFERLRLLLLPHGSIKEFH
mmetsp:Transcript_13429/g.29162  ORF Transcript_13429/g.29162 Transcript_13429/m.29162 type:complete len:292 (-) Transcript_13429:138-1013(-)